MATMTPVPTDGTLTKIALAGRLDTEGVDQIEIKFNAATCPAAKPTLLDFSEVTFLSSMGVRMLVSAARTLSRRRAKMVIFAPQPLVRESMANASLDELIPVAETEADAIQLLT